jgi:TolA-binding protein
MNQSDPTLQQLRRQRNMAGAIAVGLLLIGLGVAVPRGLARYRALVGTRHELADLQDQLRELQSKIVETQKQIIAQQQQILALQKK